MRAKSYLKLNNRQLYYRLLAIFILAAIIYNSWPLAYIIDSKVSRRGVVSNLELPGHPHFRVFLDGDIIAGVIIVLLGLMINFVKYKYKLKQFSYYVVSFGLVDFGFFTAFGAGAPDICTHRLRNQCVHIEGRLLSPDSLMSAFAMLGLFIATCGALYLAVIKLPEIYSYISGLILAIFFSLASWITISAFYFYSIHRIEEVFLIVCGLALVLIGVNILSIWQSYLAYPPT